MKKFRYSFAVFILTMVTLTACGKEKENKPNTYSPSQNDTDIITTADANSPIVNINNIVAKAGDTIDYMKSIQSVENMELEKSMIYIDSSAVDTSTPGVYTATYTFDYMGTTINRMITVTIEASENSETSSDEESSLPENTETSSAENSSAGESTQENMESSSSFPDNTETLDTVISETSSSASTEGITTPYDVTLDTQDIPDASITLSNGTVATIKCTPDRYIVETFTDETYYDENGFTYLKSELKVAFNTGDVQVVETVITRVASNPNQE